MLSRTASNLYWMARYLERAEATIRLLGACFQPGMPFSGNITKLYTLPLEVQGVLYEFTSQYGNDSKNLTVESVSKFMISGNCSASIRSSLEYARENARSERSRLSSEVWETINQTWIEFQDMQHKPIDEFADWLKMRAFLVQGTMQITMPKNLGLQFIKLGTFLERANQTLQVLEANSRLNRINHVEHDYYHWQMLLRAVSSFEAYKETYPEAPSEGKVLELLLLHKGIPRSVRTCVERTKGLIESISSISNKNKEALKISSRLLVILKYDDISDIAKVGQEKYIKILQQELYNFGLAIQEGYFITI